MENESSPKASSSKEPFKESEAEESLEITAEDPFSDAEETKGNRRSTRIKAKTDQVALDTSMASNVSNASEVAPDDVATKRQSPKKKRVQKLSLIHYETMEDFKEAKLEDAIKNEPTYKELRDYWIEKFSLGETPGYSPKWATKWRDPFCWWWCRHCHWSGRRNEPIEHLNHIIYHHYRHIIKMEVMKGNLPRISWFETDDLKQGLICPKKGENGCSRTDKGLTLDFMHHYVEFHVNLTDYIKPSSLEPREYDVEPIATTEYQENVFGPGPQWTKGMWNSKKDPHTGLYDVPEKFWPFMPAKIDGETLKPHFKVPEGASSYRHPQNLNDVEGWHKQLAEHKAKFEFIMDNTQLFSKVTDAIVTLFGVDAYGRNLLPELPNVPELDKAAFVKDTICKLIDPTSYGLEEKYYENNLTLFENIFLYGFPGYKSYLADRNRYSTPLSPKEETEEVEEKPNDASLGISKLDVTGDNTKHDKVLTSAALNSTNETSGNQLEISEEQKLVAPTSLPSDGINLSLDLNNSGLLAGAAALGRETPQIKPLVDAMREESPSLKNDKSSTPTTSEQVIKSPGPSTSKELNVGSLYQVTVTPTGKSALSKRQYSEYATQAFERMAGLISQVPEDEEFKATIVDIATKAGMTGKITTGHGYDDLLNLAKAELIIGHHSVAQKMTDNLAEAVKQAKKVVGYVDDEGIARSNLESLQLILKKIEAMKLPEMIKSGNELVTKLGNENIDGVKNLKKLGEQNKLGGEQITKLEQVNNAHKENMKNGLLTITGNVRNKIDLMVPPAVEKEVKAKAYTYVDKTWVQLNKTVAEHDKFVKAEKVKAIKRKALPSTSANAPPAKKQNKGKITCKAQEPEKEAPDDDDEEDDYKDRSVGSFMIRSYESVTKGSSSSAVKKSDDRSKMKNTSGKTTKSATIVSPETASKTKPKEKELTPKPKANPAFHSIPPGVRKAAMLNVKEMTEEQKLRRISINNRKSAKHDYMSKDCKNQNAALQESIKRSREEERKKAAEEAKLVAAKRRRSLTHPTEEIEKQRLDSYERSMSRKRSENRK